jgi:hypothetical protein
MTGVENVLVTRRWISIFVSPGVALVSTWHSSLLSSCCCTVCHKHTQATSDVGKIKFSENYIPVMLLLMTLDVVCRSLCVVNEQMGLSQLQNLNPEYLM